MHLVIITNNLENPGNEAVQKITFFVERERQKVTEGFLCLNVATWLFDTSKESARSMYEKFLREAKENCFPVLDIRLPTPCDSIILNAHDRTRTLLQSALTLPSSPPK